MAFNDELDLGNLDWETKIKVGAIGTIQSYEDLAPLLDDLSERFCNLSVHVSPIEPPAAGFSEIAVSISWAVEAAKEHPFLTYAALRFVDTLLEDGARKIRAEIARVTREARANRHGRRFVPLEINLGPVKFLFHRPMVEAGLVDQFEGMKATVSSLPTGTFVTRRTGEFTNWFFWDSERGNWQMVNEGESGWWPDDLWDD